MKVVKHAQYQLTLPDGQVRELTRKQVEKMIKSIPGTSIKVMNLLDGGTVLNYNVGEFKKIQTPRKEYKCWNKTQSRRENPFR